MKALYKKLHREREQHANREALRGQQDTVESRVGRVRDIHVRGEKRLFAVMYTTIHKAALDGSCQGILHFVNCRLAHVEDFDCKGMCAIHYAAERGHLAVVQLLLSLKCEVDLRSLDGSTPAMFAAKGNHSSVVRALHEHQADLMAVNRSGHSAAHFACFGDHASVLECLVELVAADANYIAENMARVRREDKTPYKITGDPVAAPVKETTALEDFLAQCIREDRVFTRSLAAYLDLPKAAVLDIASNNGARPLHLAAASDSCLAIALLLHMGVDVDAADSSGDTALHKACRHHHTGACRLLLAKGARDDLLNRMLESPAGLLRDESHVY